MKEKYQHIILAHQAKIYKICYGFCKEQDEVQDLFQEACINIWLGLKFFEGKSNIATWIYRVTVNTCLLYQRKQQKSRLVYTEQLEQVDQQTLQKKIELEEDIELLYTCIRSLNDKDKSIIMLYLEGLSYKEIEDILGMNQNALAVRVNRIKKNIKNQFINHGRIKSNLGKSQ
ncbi:MAG: sigma-70 family RNA polymerase sigma factor [Bacteroidota bacterium]